MLLAGAISHFCQSVAYKLLNYCHTASTAALHCIAFAILGNNGKIMGRRAVTAECWRSSEGQDASRTMSVQCNNWGPALSCGCFCHWAGWQAVPCSGRGIQRRGVPCCPNLLWPMCGCEEPPKQGDGEGILKNVHVFLFKKGTSVNSQHGERGRALVSSPPGHRRDGLVGDIQWSLEAFVSAQHSISRKQICSNSCIQTPHKEE